MTSTRRSFVVASGAALAARPFAARAGGPRPASLPTIDLVAHERRRVLAAADRYLAEQPVTVTASSSPRSAGGKHEYYSESDYFWPDPARPDGPYRERDGLTNPDNFLGHRRALMRLSVQMPALTAASLISGKHKYADHAAKHLRAWFIDPETSMSPHLKYAQAVRGGVTGRSYGIIDTIHLVEVTRAAAALELPAADRAALQAWFTAYLTWISTHPFGIAERDAKNNHSTCWAMQAAAFARFTGDETVLAMCRDRYKSVLLPNQLDADGSFPREMRRTKPYGYSLFNVDAMAAVCQLLTTPTDNLWTFELPDRRGMRKAMAFIYPYILDKKRWPRPPDVMYWADWPVRHASLLFGGLALGEPSYIALWKHLNPDPTVEEIVRNYPIRQPVLWVDSVGSAR
jgi:hypothetical protein